MLTLGIGSFQALVDVLEFELEELRRQAEIERLLRSIEVDRAPSHRVDRSFGRRPRPGTPRLSGAH